MHLRDFEDFPTALTYVKEVDENKNKKPNETWMKMSETTEWFRVSWK